MKQRKLTPEILDELPSDDPQAIRSRHDLAFIDAMMGNYRWLASNIKAGTWIELGAGAGGISRFITDKSAVHITGIDLAPRPERWPGEWSWHQGDLFQLLGDSAKDASGIAASLFLHHFTDQQLSAIGKLIPDSVSELVFCEPARFHLHKLQGYLGFPLFNSVTRHDMIVSIEAGFRGEELAAALQLCPDHWKWRHSTSFWGAYRFHAERV